MLQNSSFSVVKILTCKTLNSNPWQKHGEHSAEKSAKCGPRQQRGNEDTGRNAEAIRPTVEEVVDYKEETEGQHFVGAGRVVEQGAHRLLGGLEISSRVLKHTSKYIKMISRGEMSKKLL